MSAKYKGILSPFGYQEDSFLDGKFVASVALKIWMGISKRRRGVRMVHDNFLDPVVEISKGRIDSLARSTIV
jgi:hypothetical protein